MPEDVIILEIEARVATITLNRPEKRNSLNPEMLLKMAAHLAELSKSDETRAVVIRGQGDRSFSSGYDIGQIPTMISTELAEELKSKNPLEIGLGAIERYPYPVIAMIDGYAYGAACELAMTCDLRVASDTSSMGIPPSRLGLVYHPSGLQRFINVIGLAYAKEVFYTGRFYDINRAHAMGMVNYVVPKAELHAFTYTLAAEIAGNAPLSLKGHKAIFKALHQHQGIGPEDRERIEKLILEAFNSEDLKEGAAAFFAKRKPVFKGT